MNARDVTQSDGVTLKAMDTLGPTDDIMRCGHLRHPAVVSVDRPVGILALEKRGGCQRVREDGTIVGLLNGTGCGRHPARVLWVLEICSELPERME